jgi:hypothetical protein
MERLPSILIVPAHGRALLRIVAVLFLILFTTRPPASHAQDAGASSKPTTQTSEEDSDLDTPYEEEQSPPGYAGPSGVLERVEPTDRDFLPTEDRWRIGFPKYDRFGRHHPSDAVTMGAMSGNYPYVEGRWFDPYNQNVLKGDYPIIGQHTFMNITATSDTVFEYRRVPTPSNESSEEQGEFKFFGKENQRFFNQNLILRVDVFHGSAAFKPFDWRIRLTPVVNWNHLDVEERGTVNVDVRDGTWRSRRDFALQEAFVEVKLADLSPHYDFVSLRAGRQVFVSDFRGFIFNDVNQGVRLFGNSDANRNQYNLVYFYQAEKETNSELNMWDARHQHVVVANLYRQDSLDFDFLPTTWRKGYTSQWSVHYSDDQQESEIPHFDKNGFLIRPEAVGSFIPHDVNAAYLGWTGDGHIDRMNLTHAFYWALGRDDFNNIAGRRITVNSQMFAIEPSVDIDWFRLRSSFFWASGDRSPQDAEGRGFDAIFDNPNFAGGPFSFWNRQAIRLLGTNLKSRNSLLPDLAPGKTESQQNFVNPGLFLANVGFDAELTPKTKFIFNTSYIWFAHPESLELFLKQPNIARAIGTDISAGLQYRPFLNNNVIFLAGFGTLIPGRGFEQIFESEKPLYSIFTSLTLTY